MFFYLFLAILKCKGTNYITFGRANLQNHNSIQNHSALHLASH
ncbi:Hypothetical protein I595_1283 [Croceitalea dokdonensis DOKDO 023]|uniref:Uncharacterized protein n=1 Tax=Croceitalea dokdonensis DOKDO 023 TaxID=1300341 RepID=A0A0P7AXR7_9FLAO|nr:Hypothetical protein I595_1283 [Croceitalea dokdonensis DOKDO 023]